jgi:hypothetical protein
MTESDYRMFDLEAAGYMKSLSSGKWMEKVYTVKHVLKDKNVPVYRWEYVKDEGDIALLEEGLNPQSFRLTDN